MKKLFPVICVLALMLSVTGCIFTSRLEPSTPTLTIDPPAKTTPPETPVPTPKVTPTTTPTPEATPEPMPTQEPLETLPSQCDISVNREGETETFAGNLHISERGYAIYLLDDFIFEAQSDLDVVRPSSNSELMSEIYMHIYAVDPTTATAATVYRFPIGDLWFEVEFFYPLEASEGGAMLLYAMAETICPLERVTP